MDHIIKCSAVSSVLLQQSWSGLAPLGPPLHGYATDNHYTISSIYPSCRNLNDVEDMMEDIQEQNEIAEEFTKIVTQPIGVQDFDEVS